MLAGVEVPRGQEARRIEFRMNSDFQRNPCSGFTIPRFMNDINNAMKTIIAAVDFSNATPAVAETAVNIAKCINANVELFHAIEPQPTFSTYGLTMTELSAMDELRSETLRRTTGLLENLLAKVREDIPGATSHLAVGNPLRELIEHAKQTGADFVVVGSHGHCALGSLILGSVAEGMVRTATVPTLVVPATPECILESLTTPQPMSCKVPRHDPAAPGRRTNAPGRKSVPANFPVNKPHLPNI